MRIAFLKLQSDRPWFLALLAGGFLVAAQAHAQGVIDMGSSMPDQDAKSHFKVGKSLYEAGRFAEAAAEWEKAYELSNKPDLLYNVYIAYRDASDQPHAIDALQRYLERADMDVDTRANLQARLRAMQEANTRSTAQGATPGDQAAAAESETGAASAPAAQPAPTAAAAAAPRRETPASSPSLAPYVVLGAGGALLVGSLVTGIVTSAKIARIEDRCPNDSCPSGYDLSGNRHDARVLRAVTLVLGGVGVATAAVGAALFATRDGAEHPPSESGGAALQCGAHACLATYRGHF